MIYRVEIRESALKSLRKMPRKVQGQINEAILGLRSNPRPHGVQKIVGEEAMYRIYSGSYRIVYDIFDDQLIVNVIRIGHRKDVYRNL